MTLASLGEDDRTRPDPRGTTKGQASGSPRGRLATDTRTRLARVETSEEFAIDEMAEATWNLPSAKEAELAAEAGNAESIDLRVGADRRPAPVTDLMIAKARRPCRCEAERS